MNKNLSPMQEQEKRRYFRIDDQVGLDLAAIPAEGEEAAITGFADSSARVGLVNELRAIRDENLLKRRSLESRFPTVAAYIALLERQIDTLAFAIDERDEFPNHPGTAVNLSAQGLRFETKAGFSPDSLLEVRLALFPDRSRIKALARVITTKGGESGTETAVEFTHLRDADREAIIHHVHALQRKRLQAQAMQDD